MRAHFICTAVAFTVAACLLSAKTPDEFGKRVAVGLTCGTDGVGVTVATAYGNHIGFRTGLSSIPAFLGTTVPVTVGSGIHEVPDGTVPFRIESNAVLYHALLDVYPFRGGDVRLTAGLFAGEGKRAFTVTSARALPSVGGYAPLCFECDLPMVLPYAGVGAGRAVRDGGRLQVGFDVGLAWKGNSTVVAVPSSGSPDRVVLGESDLDALESRIMDPLRQTTGKGLLSWFSGTEFLPIFRISLTWKIF